MKPISVRDVLASPESFDGKRVLVYGVYMKRFEHQFLDGGCPAGEDWKGGAANIWLDTEEYTEWVGVSGELNHYSQAVVEGEYRHGKCGHCGVYPGQLTDISIVR